MRLQAVESTGRRGMEKTKAVIASYVGVLMYSALVFVETWKIALGDVAVVLVPEEGRGASLVSRGLSIPAGFSPETSTTV